MSNKVIVTGASGFTGQYMLEELLRNEYKVIATYHSHSANKIEDCEWKHIELQDLQACEKLISDVQPDVVIHLAAQNNIVVSQKEPEETLRQNFFSTLNLLNAIRLHSVKTKCILAGSAMVYEGNSKHFKLTEDAPIDITNAYALTKSFQEQIAMMYVKEYGMNIVCTRPFNYIGYKQSEKSFVASLCYQISEIAKGRRENVLYLGDLESYRDFSDVRDVVRAYRLLFEKDVKAGIYNISSGNAICLKEIVNYLCSKYVGEINVVQESHLIRKNDVTYLCGDCTKLKKCTGWSAKYNIFDTIDWIYEKMMEE